MNKEKKSFGPQPWVTPQPAFLVGTYDAVGKPNVMVAAWGGICCSDPVCLNVSIRPARWTLDAALTNKAFTISIPTESMLAPMDFVGMASGRRYDKFVMTGWTPVKAEKVNAPYVGESPLVLECSLLQSHNLGVHVMLIGKIEDVKVDTDCLDPQGTFPDLAKYAPIIFDSANSNYYGMGKLLGKSFSVGKSLFKE